MRRIINCLLSIFLLGCIGLSGYKIYEYYHEYRVGEDIYKAISDSVQINEEDSSDNKTISVEDDSTDGDDMIKRQIICFDKLKEINSDAVGWIRIEDSEIDYPVLQCNDNKTYLTQTITGEYNKSGSIFVDCMVETPFENSNTVIYGHNMKDNNMFGSLKKYRNEEWFITHPIILIQTESDLLEYEIFSVHIVDENEEAYQLDFESQSVEFYNWLLKMKNDSLYDTFVTPEYSDVIITLSTCTNASNSERLVVQACRHTMSSMYSN